MPGKKKFGARSDGAGFGRFPSSRWVTVPRARPVAMFRSIRARELDPGGRLGARGGCASTSSSCRAPTLGWPEKELGSWAEADALSNCTATYSDLRPAPRSTIAAAFSPDGKLLASTHGDHTVKLIDCRTGRCVRTLTGHRRTPWVVRYHPTDPNVLASGSLDHQVRVWNATTAECVVCFDFAKPIASLAFHAEGDVLAVASGHKLYTYNYTKSPHWRRAAAARRREKPRRGRRTRPRAARGGRSLRRYLPPRPRLHRRRRRRGRPVRPTGVPSVHLPPHETTAPCTSTRGAPLALRRGGERDERTGRAPAPRDRSRAETRGGVGERRTRRPPPPPRRRVRRGKAPAPESSRLAPRLPESRIARRRARTALAPRSHRDARVRSEDDSRRTLWVAFGFVRPARRPRGVLFRRRRRPTRARRNNVARRSRRRRWRWAT